MARPRRTGPVDLYAAFGESKRTLKSGKVRSKNIVNFHVTNPLNLNLDAKPIAANLARHIRDDIERQILANRKPVAPETLERRQRRERQWANNPTSSLRKRYSGGRIGPTAPQGGPYLLNESGRLAKNLAMRVRKRSTGEAVVTMNVPKNRLDPTTFGGGQAALEENVFRHLREIVSWFSTSGVSSRDNRVLDKAADDSIEYIHNYSKAEARRERIEAAKAVLDLIRTLGAFA